MAISSPVTVPARRALNVTAKIGGQLRIAIVLLHQKNRYGETVESRGKNRQAGIANLMDKNANALQRDAVQIFNVVLFQP